MPLECTSKYVEKSKLAAISSISGDMIKADIDFFASLITIK